MFGYYLRLAARSFRRNVGLTALMVIAIAFGIGASMTTLTVLHVLSADPIPRKSDRLFYVQLDARPGTNPAREPAEAVTRFDAEALVRARRADRQAMMSGGSVAVEPDRAGLSPFMTPARYTSSELFAMFEVPFLAGGAWTAADDESAARVAVIGKELADKLFGAVDVVGRTVRIDGADLRITGVIDSWQPTPHFYDLTTGFNTIELVYVPFSTSRALKMARSGNMDCWRETADSEALGAPCVWLQLWVELGDASKAAAYRDYLTRYSQEQQTAGRFEHAPNIRLRDVTEWLSYKQVVPRDVRLQSWIALGFLLVCLVNTIGLLLTKFLRRSAELGVRRALGASKRAIFAQLLIEAGAIGLAGGAIGLGLALLGLWVVRAQPTEYAELAHLDLPMLAATFGLAIVTSLLAGVLPAWRGCQVTVAAQLKAH